MVPSAPSGLSHFTHLTTELRARGSGGFQGRVVWGRRYMHSPSYVWPAFMLRPFCGVPPDEEEMAIMLAKGSLAFSSDDQDSSQEGDSLQVSSLPDGLHSSGLWRPDLKQRAVCLA